MKNEYKLEISYPKTDNNPDGNPLPTQVKFHRSQKMERVLAGGWGSGKTRALILEMAKDIAIPNNYILLGRLDMGELISSTMKDFLEVYGDIVINHNKQERTILFPNRTIVYYTNLDASRDAVKKIQSLNLGAVVLDQLEEIDESVYIALIGRLRREGARRCIYSAMNPNGHDWIYHRFFVEKDDGREIFVTTTLENIYLPKDYVDRLLKMPEQWVKRYVYCSFDEWEGMVYEKYNDTIHKIPMYVPSVYEKHYIVLDYGFRNPTAILWISVDYDGIARVWDEYYKSNELIEDIAVTIKTKHPEIYENATLLIDPSAYYSRQDGLTIADEFMKYGVYFLPADNILMQGIDRVNSLLSNNKLFICSNCENTLKEISNYRWKSFNKTFRRNYPEEPLKKDDHAMDCLRYFANYINAPEKKEQVILPKWAEKLRRKYRTETSFMGI